MEKNKGSVRIGARERLWREIISGQPRSGMTVLEWCQRHGVSAPTFYVWRQKLAERKPVRSSVLPVEIISSTVDRNLPSLEIELPSQTRVRVQPGCDVELLRQVLRILRQDGREAQEC